ncbi:MAG: TRL domain-containing protein [Alphaproteobacteria bacterium]|jgi:hypothetical protein
MRNIFIISAFALLMSACSFQRTPFMNTTQIQDIDFSDIGSYREGRDCAYWILGLIGPFGDNSLPDAIRDANITKVSIVDYSTHYYVLYGKECLRVYGK